MVKKSEAGKKEEELQVVVYTPDGIKAETKARHLVVPGAEGDTMILPEHCGLVIPLRVGVLQIHHPGSVEYYSVSGGTLMVDEDNVNVSAFAAEEGRSIDRYRAESAKERAEAVLASDAEDHTIEMARIALYRALIRLEVHDLSRRE